MTTKTYPRCADCCTSHPPPVPRCRVYNGWTNYETWAVALWINSDQSTQQNWIQAGCAALDQAQADGCATQREHAASDLAHELKEEITAGAPDLGPSVYSDLLEAALSEVNWYEIALTLLPEAAR